MAGSYFRHELDGVEIYTSRGLMVAAPALTISLGGFWKLRWLKVAGAAAAAACAC